MLTEINWDKNLKLLCIPPVRWEYVYILEALNHFGMLKNSTQGLGFGVGKEPITGLLASYGFKITATDLEHNIALKKGWVNTNQHVSSIDTLYLKRMKFE